jgi:hypothetical protein
MANSPAEKTYDSHHPIALSANEYLHYEIASTGLSARMWSGAVVFGLCEYWGGCKEVAVACPDEESFVASVLVDLYTDRHRTLTVSDRIEGTGSSIEASVRDAMKKYALNVFLAFHRMHAPTVRDPDTKSLGFDTYSELTDRKTQWTVFQGGRLMQVAGSSVEAMVKTSAEKPLLAYVIDEVSEVLGDDDRLHWVKLYLSRSEAGRIAGECAIDNALAPSAGTKLEAFPWPEATSYQWLRQFYVLQPSR